MHPHPFYPHPFKQDILKETSGRLFFLIIVKDIFKQYFGAQIVFLTFFWEENEEILRILGFGNKKFSISPAHDLATRVGKNLITATMGRHSGRMPCLSRRWLSV